MKRSAALLTGLLVWTLFGLASCVSMTDAGVLLGKEYYNLGNAYFAIKKYDEAGRAYQTALNYAPDLKIAGLNLARTKAELGDTAGALALMAPMVQADPDNLTVLQQYAWLLYKAGNFDEAATQWTALAQKLPADPATQFNTGIVLLADGKKVEALTPLDQWSTLDGKNADGLLLLADLRANLKPEDGGDELKALDVYRKGLDVATDKSVTKKNLASGYAKVLESQKRYGEAVEAWKTALDIPAVPGKEADQAAGWFRLGSLQLLQIEDYDEGFKDLKEAWTEGYKTSADWKALMDNPDLKFHDALQIDLKAAGVTW